MDGGIGEKSGDSRERHIKTTEFQEDCDELLLIFRLSHQWDP